MLGFIWVLCPMYVYVMFVLGFKLVYAPLCMWECVCMFGREHVRFWVVLGLVWLEIDSDLSFRGNQVRPSKVCSAAEPAWEAALAA